MGFDRGCVATIFQVWRLRVYMRPCPKTLTCDSVPPLCPLVGLLGGASRCQFRLVSPEKQKRVAPLILLGETHFESGGRWEIRTLDPYRVKVML